MSEGQNFEVDLSKLQDEINSMSPEQLREDLIKIRTQRRKMQLKTTGSDAAKRYQAKAREKYKLLKAAAVEGGFWDDVNEIANQRAADELAASTEVE